MNVEFTVSDAAEIAPTRQRIKTAAELLGCDAIQSSRFAANVGDALRDRLATTGDPVMVTFTITADRDSTRLRLGVGDAACVGSIRLDSVRHRRDAATLEAVRDSLTHRSRAQLAREVHAQNQRLIEREHMLKEALREARGATAAQIALREARAATEAKSAFLASMSHELRTPLNSILGFTKRLLKRLDDQISDRDYDALQTVHRNSRHLLGLINDILDLSKIEAGRMDLAVEPCSVAALVGEVCRQCEPLLDSETQTLFLVPARSELSLVADATKVRQIASNLVSNAIKYGGRGTIKVSAVSKQDDRLGDVVVIAVSDEGEGITPEQQASLFRPFTRLATGATKRAAGTGLGLTISQRYAAMHGGRIDVESEPGVGSVFSLVLPVRQESRRASSIRRSARLSLLAIDDDPEIVRVARSSLSTLDVDVEHADSLGDVRVLVDAGGIDIVWLGRGHESAEAWLLEAGVAVLRGDAVPAHASAATLVMHLRTSVLLALADRLSGVLIVEDNPDARAGMAEAFAPTGARLVFAGSGEEALAALAEDPLPSALVLDLMLPGLSGFDVLVEVRESERLAKLPIIVLSALSLTGSQLAGVESLVSAFLEKGEGAPMRAVTAALAATRNGGGAP